MKEVFRFFFPFTGKVKTQLKIVRGKDGKTGLIKPANVKKFEKNVKTILAIAFPEELRPIHGYIEFTLNHYTKYKRDKDGFMIPENYARFDADNLLKVMQDCFQPTKQKLTKFDDKGQAVMTEKGNVSYEWFVVEPGVISDDKYIYRASTNWVPVEEKDDEGLEVFIRLLNEDEIKKPIVPKGNIINYNINL